MNDGDIDHLMTIKSIMIITSVIHQEFVMLTWSVDSSHLSWSSSVIDSVIHHDDYDDDHDDEIRGNSIIRYHYDYKINIIIQLSVSNSSSTKPNSTASESHIQLFLEVQGSHNPEMTTWHFITQTTLGDLPHVQHGPFRRFGSLGRELDHVFQRSSLKDHTPVIEPFEDNPAKPFSRPMASGFIFSQSTHQSLVVLISPRPIANSRYSIWVKHVRPHHPIKSS